MRFGFSARLIDLLNNYQISSNNVVEALVLKQYDLPEQVDFRMHFRVRLPSKSNISLFLKEEKVNLLDISVGGAKFAYPKSNALIYGDVINCKLTINSTVFDLKGRVRNIITPQSSQSSSAKETIQYVGVEFEHERENKQFDVVLGRAIIDIERQMLAEGKMN